MWGDHDFTVALRYDVILDQLECGQLYNHKWGVSNYAKCNNNQQNL